MQAGEYEVVEAMELDVMLVLSLSRSISLLALNGLLREKAARDAMKQVVCVCVCCAFPLCDIHTQTQVALISTFNGRHEALMIASAQGCALVD